MTRTITITSGKGGVGKTNLSLNLALELARLGHHTCLFDADFGTANVNILLGISPRYDIKDVISKDKVLNEIIIAEGEKIDLLPGSSGVEEMANLSSEQIDGLLSSMSAMEEYDYLLIDTAAGISKNVVSFCLASSEVVLVITHEPTSLTDAYALLKVLAANDFNVIITGRRKENLESLEKEIQLKTSARVLSLRRQSQCGPADDRGGRI